MDILPDASNQVLRVKGSLKEGQDGWQLGCAHPLGVGHVVLVDVVRAENWPALRACHLVLLLDFLSVL